MLKEGLHWQTSAVPEIPLGHPKHHPWTFLEPSSKSIPNLAYKFQLRREAGK